MILSSPDFTAKSYGDSPALFANFVSAPHLKRKRLPELAIIFLPFLWTKAIKLTKSDSTVYGCCYKRSVTEFRLRCAYKDYDHNDFQRNALLPDKLTPVSYVAF